MKRFWKELALPVKIIVILGLILGIQAGGAALGFWSKMNLKSLFGGRKYVNVCVVPWGGYAGGQLYNGGFEPSKESRYYTEQGILVKFTVIEDFAASRAALKKGDIDLIWTTADAFPTEVHGMAEFKPKIVFQSDWSRGGDVIVAVWDITTVAQLRGRKVAVAFGTPSHTFILQTLKAQGLNYNDVQIIEAPSAVDAANMFKSGAVDAAVVWSPDDELCVQAIPRSHVLTSTREATHIIADVFYGKEEWIEQNQAKLTKLIRGWMIGAAEINTSKLERERQLTANPKAELNPATPLGQAVQILSAGLTQPADVMEKAIFNARLNTMGDNLNFFGLNPSYRGVKGDELYMKTGELYRGIGMVEGTLPPWRSVIDLRALQAITDLTGGANAAESAVQFTKVTPEDLRQAPSLTEKATSVNFATGAYVLDDNARKVIDLSGVADDLKRFGEMGLRVEGNTDNVGNAKMNKQLSEKRAQAVVEYIIQAYGVDPKRVTWVGNGPDKPVADNTTDIGRAKNRRTDFMLVRVKK